MLTDEQLLHAWSNGKLSDRAFLVNLLGTGVFNAASAFTKDEWQKIQDATEGNFE